MVALGLDVLDECSLAFLRFQLLVSIYLIILFCVRSHSLLLHHLFQWLHLLCDVI